MVCRRRQARASGAPGGEERRHQDRARDLGQDLVQLAREYPALVRLAPVVVGPPDSGVVRPERTSSSRDRRTLLQLTRSREGSGGARRSPRRDSSKEATGAASSAAAGAFGRTRTCSTPGSPRRCGRSPRSAGPRRPRTSAATTPTTSSSPASTSCSSGTRGWRCRGSSSWARRRGRRSTSTASSATRRARRCPSRRAIPSTRSG